MSETANVKQGEPAPLKHQQDAREKAERLGPAGAARELGLDPSTFARLVGGLPLRRGTLALLREKLGVAS